MRRFVLVLLVTMLAGCGVKNDLVRPNGKPTPQDQRDPSLPPAPVGR
jgi:hypothetical protein